MAGMGLRPLDTGPRGQRQAVERRTKAGPNPSETRLDIPSHNHHIAKHPIQCCPLRRRTTSSRCNRRAVQRPENPMRAGMRRWTQRAAHCLCALMVTAASIGEAQQSSIGGVVTDQATGQPLEAARVVLMGIDRIVGTNQEGRYLFRNIAPGSYGVRVLRLGYAPLTDSAHVAPGEEVAL